MAKADLFNNLYWQGEKLPPHENIWTSTNVDKWNKKKRRGYKEDTPPCKISHNEGRSILHSSKE